MADYLGVREISRNAEEIVVDVRLRLTADELARLRQHGLKVGESPRKPKSVDVA